MYVGFSASSVFDWAEAGSKAATKHTAERIIALRAFTETSLVYRMILPLRMAFQLFPVEIDFAQVPGGVALHFIVEVRRLRVPAFPSSCHRPGTHFVAKLHHRDEAVASGSVPLLRSW